MLWCRDLEGTGSLEVPAASLEDFVALEILEKGTPARDMWRLPFSIETDIPFFSALAAWSGNSQFGRSSVFPGGYQGGNPKLTLALDGILVGWKLAEGSFRIAVFASTRPGRAVLVGNQFVERSEFAAVKGEANTLARKHAQKFVSSMLQRDIEQWFEFEGRTSCVVQPDSIHFIDRKYRNGVPFHRDGTDHEPGFSLFFQFAWGDRLVGFWCEPLPGSSVKMHVFDSRGISPNSSDILPPHHIQPLAYSQEIMGEMRRASVPMAERIAAAMGRLDALGGAK